MNVSRSHMYTVQWSILQKSFKINDLWNRKVCTLSSFGKETWRLYFEEKKWTTNGKFRVKCLSSNLFNFLFSKKHLWNQDIPEILWIPIKRVKSNKLSLLICTYFCKLDLPAEAYTAGGKGYGGSAPCPPWKLKSIVYKGFLLRLDRKKSFYPTLDKFLCMPLFPSICSRVHCTAHICSRVHCTAHIFLSLSIKENVHTNQISFELLIQNLQARFTMVPSNLMSEKQLFMFCFLSENWLFLMWPL